MHINDEGANHLPFCIRMGCLWLAARRQLRDCVSFGLFPQDGSARGRLTCACAYRIIGVEHGRASWRDFETSWKE